MKLTRLCARPGQWKLSRNSLLPRRKHRLKNMPPELRLSLIPSRKLKKYPGSSRLYCPCLNSQIVLCRFPLAILSIPFRARPKWTITRARPNSTSLVFLAGWYRLAASSCGRSRVIRPCLWLRMPPSSPPLFFLTSPFSLASPIKFKKFTTAKSRKRLADTKTPKKSKSQSFNTMKDRNHTITLKEEFSKIARLISEKPQNQLHQAFVRLIFKILEESLEEKIKTQGKMRRG